MERVAAARQYERLHEDAPWHDGTFTSWRKEPSASHPYRADDGVTIWVASVDLNPDDEFTTKRDASPVKGGDDVGGSPGASNR